MPGSETRQGLRIEKGIGRLLLTHRRAGCQMHRARTRLATRVSTDGYVRSSRPIDGSFPTLTRNRPTIDGPASDR
ncbi:MAG: hypothetical protein EHM77_01770 [Planctomycetaceae bacterium]|nr:MAG: hypothetical protein EHM77_01770 [Planctomycetaceae bacterium]